MADQRLEEASQPAYMDQILTAEGLIRYFDRSSTGASTSSPVEPGKLAAQASRTVAAGDLKGVKVVRKDEREDNYFMGGGGKKNKKGRKNGANTGPGTGTASPTSGTGTATPTEGAGATGGKFNLSVGVIEELGKVDIEPPMGQADVPGVVEKLKAKLERWKKDQDRQTKAVSLISPLFSQFQISPAFFCGVRDSYQSDDYDDQDDNVAGSVHIFHSMD